MVESWEHWKVEKWVAALAVQKAVQLASKKASLKAALTAERTAESLVERTDVGLVGGSVISKVAMTVDSWADR